MGIANSMEIGFSTASFFGKTCTEDSFAQIAGYGAHICEVFLTTFYEYEPQFCDLLLTRKGDIKVHSIHSLNTHFEPQLYNSVDRTRKDAEEIMVKVLTTAQRLGASEYTFHGVARLKNRAPVCDYERVGLRTQALCALCEKYGITLCYENVHWAYYSYPTFFQGIKKYCPKLGACLDIKQAMQSGHDYREYLDDMGDAVRTVHICDYDENGKLCMPGKGIFDFKTLFSELRARKIDCPVMIEVYSGDYTCDQQLQDSFNYIHSL